MSMWNPFGNRNKTKGNNSPKIAQITINRIESLANTFQGDGRAIDLENELKTLNLSEYTKIEQETWWHLYGIVAFQQGQDNEALQRFKEAYRLFPNSYQIRFSLGQQLIRSQEVEKGFELFRECKFPNVSREFAFAQARYAYLWDHLEDGLAFLRPFYDSYKNIKILDDHFLYVRGLPFFGKWWSYFAAFSILRRDFKELELITNYVVKNCHEYDFDQLQLELKSYQLNEPELLLAAKESRLIEMENLASSSGYTRMNIAVIKARKCNTLLAAKDIISAVSFSNSDFPWLKDIRTLALAEVYNRFGESDLEKECIKNFIHHQPMLFEPDIALTFFLLHYQEKIKSHNLPFKS